MTYSPPDYWTERGRTYEAEYGDGETPELMALLERLAFGSVLDAGCGYGRIGAAILRRWPVEYTGIDVSVDLLASARVRLPFVEFICADLATWIPTRRWDLVIAQSVLSHLLAADVAAVVARLREAARHDFIVIDWDEAGGSTPYQFAHDWLRLLPTATRTPLGRLAMYHERRP